MADYSYYDLYLAAKKGGFRYGDGLVIGVAVSLGENTGRVLKAVYTNTDGSRDRGPWQINDKWQPQVTDAEAFDLEESSREAYLIYKGRGNSFSAWAAYTNGRFEQFLDIAYLCHALNTAEVARDAAKADLAAAKAQLATVTTERDRYLAERNTARAERDTARAERDAARASLAIAIAERDAARAQVTTLTSERDTARTERDAALAEVARKNVAIDSALATLQAAR